MISRAWRARSGTGWRLRFAAILLAAAGAAAGATPPAPDSRAAAATSIESEPVDLVIANRTIFTMRADGYAGAPPRERARVVRDNIHALVENGGPLEVTTQVTAEGILVLVDGRLAFRVQQGDVNPEGGETVEALADRAVRNFERGLREIREARDSRALLPAIGLTLLASLVLAGALWLVFRAQRWLMDRLRALVARHWATLAPNWGKLLLGPGGPTGLLAMPVRAFTWLVAVLLVYEWTGFVLQRFPYTRPWGEALADNMLAALGGFGSALLGAVPGLLFVALIFFLARLVARLVKAFFDGVQHGRIRVGWVDEATARPTGQLLRALVWLFALVAAYPYIPGSDSEAFRGIGVFVGLMMSIGASGIVNQAVSGLMLMYTRALRPGEFVQIGEHEGTVKSVGFVTTRIQTLRNEEVNIPNAVIASSVTRNLSRLAADGGIWVPTRVTIGYDVPWRQVHSLLELAASRTAGLEREPAPIVRQTSLQDSYVEYTLLVNVADPKRRVALLDGLHANILDAFNEFGVQIMSPNYEGDPEQPKVVPRERWFEPPAAR